MPRAHNGRSLTPNQRPHALSSPRRRPSLAKMGAVGATHDNGRYVKLTHDRPDRPSSPRVRVRPRSSSGRGGPLREVAALLVVYPQVERMAWNMESELLANSAKLALRGSCAIAGSGLVSPLRRARSASRSKQIPRAVAARRKSPGSVDESATGSANDLAPQVLSGT